MSEYLANIEKHKNEIFSAHISPEHFDTHTHGSHQLTYIIGGTTYLESEGQSHFIPARHFVWIPAHTPHKFVHRIKKAFGVKNIYIPELPNLEDNFFKQVGIYPAPNILIEILTLTANNIIKKDTHLFSFIENFLFLLPELCQDKFKLVLPLSDNKKMIEILLFIQNNLEDEITLSLVANKFNMSTRSLSRLFQEHLEMTFLAYVKQSRIIRAIELLLEANLNIGEIAEQVGYKSIAAFSNAFLEMTKTRPTTFTKK